MRIKEFRQLTLTESRSSKKELLDVNLIRARVIKEALQWYEESGYEWNFGLLPEVVAAHVRAIGAKPEESAAMAKVLKQAMKDMVEQYHTIIEEDQIFELADDLINGLEQLKSLGVYPDLVSALQKSVKASYHESMRKWEEENPDDAYNPDDDEDDDNNRVAESEVWDKPNPKKTHSKLSPEKKAAAKARAKRAGRPYPNLIDNMWASKK